MQRFSHRLSTVDRIVVWYFRAAAQSIKYTTAIRSHIHIKLNVITFDETNNSKAARTAGKTYICRYVYVLVISKSHEVNNNI